MLYSTFFALGLATAAAAITVTAPSNSTGWTSTGAQVIEWDVSLVSFAFFLSLSSLGFQSYLDAWSWLSGRMRGKSGVVGRVFTLGPSPIYPLSLDRTILTYHPYTNLSIYLALGLVSSLRSETQLTQQAVSTDPSNFTIQLINPASPNSPTELATNVMTSDNTYTYTPTSDLAVGGQWRINLVQERSDGGEQILAQSEYFEVEAG
jgi:hypothetical protein